MKVPFLQREEIKRKADLFREKFCDNKTPVDIEQILEIKLKIDIVLVPRLQDFCDSDALITSNWKNIYVDRDRYMNDRYRNRLRFSFAHEAGHYILHKDIYKKFNIKDIKDFYESLCNFPEKQYSYLESQANKFANFLLIPRERLLIEIENLLKNKVIPNNIERKTAIPYLAISIAKIFNVSEDAAEIALNDINNKF